MCNASKIVESFNINLPGYIGTYKYGGVGNPFSKKDTHNPWVWNHSTEFNAPHLTLYDNDFDVSGEVLSFHITYYYQNKKHLPVHVFFKMGVGGAVTFERVDAKRCGSSEAEAIVDMNKQLAALSTLASELVKGAFSA